MKYSECNAKQQKAWRNARCACNWLIGGLENTLQDCPEDSEDFKGAEEMLNDHDALVNELYKMATTSLYTEDGEFWGGNVSSYLKDIRFCGKEWMMKLCNGLVKKEGY